MTDRRWRVLARAITRPDNGLRTVERLLCFTIIGEALAARSREQTKASIADLCDWTKMSRAWVIKTIASLEAAGWLEVTRSTGVTGSAAPNVYRVTPRG